MTRLETERLILRPWRDDDLEPFAAVYADPDLARFIGGTCDRATAWRRLAAIVGHWTLRGHGFWALEEKQGGDFVGCCGLWFPEGWPELELGYWLMAEKQGRGYATEAALRSRAFAYEELGATTLVSYIDAENGASIRVAERIGAVPDGEVVLGQHGVHQVYRHPAP